MSRQTFVCGERPFAGANVPFAGANVPFAGASVPLTAPSVPFVEPSIPLTEPELDPAPPEVSRTIPKHAEERRGATPVVFAASISPHRGGRRRRAPGRSDCGVLLVPRWWDAATGTLSVGTSPAGIAVFVDGQPHGVTPLGVELPPGEHVIELRTETERRRIPITLTAGGQVSQYFEFARAGAGTTATGELQVRTEPLGAAVTVDGKYVGRSPVSVPDPRARTHTVVMQNETGTQTERVIIEDGRTASLVVSLGASANKASTAGWIRLDAPADVQVLEDVVSSAALNSNASCCRSDAMTWSSSIHRSAIASGEPCRSPRGRRSR
jgi:hypothetical protein